MSSILKLITTAPATRVATPNFKQAECSVGEFSVERALVENRISSSLVIGLVWGLLRFPLLWNYFVVAYPTTPNQRPALGAYVIHDGYLLQSSFSVRYPLASAPDRLKLQLCRRVHSRLRF